MEKTMKYWVATVFQVMRQSFEWQLLWKMRSLLHWLQKFWIRLSSTFLHFLGPDPLSAGLTIRPLFVAFLLVAYSSTVDQQYGHRFHKNWSFVCDSSPSGIVELRFSAHVDTGRRHVPHKKQNYDQFKNIGKQARLYRWAAGICLNDSVSSDCEIGL